MVVWEAPGEFIGVRVSIIERVEGISLFQRVLLQSTRVVTFATLQQEPSESFVTWHCILLSDSMMLPSWQNGFKDGRQAA